jgi:SAM-dependent methyltransferase
MSNEAQARNITMSTGGNYSLATLGAKHVIDGARPMLMDALEGMALGDQAAPFVMTDMGCADGGTSLETIGALLEKVRAAAPERALQMVYSDQPRNDYNALVSTVHGLGDFASYLDRISNLYVQFSGTSFYSQIVPDGTLDLGFSATAMHWLSTKPCDITGHIHATGATGDELAAFAAQGRMDQERIFAHRARELRPGGKLVLVNFCRDDAGRYLGNTGGRPMFDTMNNLWQRQVDAGAISIAEYQAMTLPQYYNSPDEFRALFEPGSALHAAGLELEHIETRVVPCPYAASFVDHGDVNRFATEYVPTLRSWTQSTFLGGLDDARPLEERQAIVEDYYATYAANVAESPDGHAMDYVHAYLVVTKRD